MRARAIRFAPTGHVHRITPCIMDELVMTDNSRNGSPGVNANPSGWGGKEVDDAMPPVEMSSVGSFWGHKREFTVEENRR